MCFVTDPFNFGMSTGSWTETFTQAYDDPRARIGRGEAAPIGNYTAEKTGVRSRFPLESAINRI